MTRKELAEEDWITVTVNSRDANQTPSANYQVSSIRLYRQYCIWTKKGKGGCTYMRHFLRAFLQPPQSEGARKGKGIRVKSKSNEN